MESLSVQGTLITSSYEINRIINDISKEQSPLTIYPEDSLSTLTSYIDEVDCRKGYMLFKTPEPEFRQPLLFKRKISITCKYRDSIITIPEIELVDEHRFEKSYFISSIPKKIFLLQRRTYYRQPILSHRKMNSKIVILENSISCKLIDISLGGCKVQFDGDLRSKLVLNNTHIIVIKLDEIKILSTNLNIKRIKYEPISNKTQVGYKFKELSDTTKESIVDLVSITFGNKNLTKLHPRNITIEKINRKININQVNKKNIDEKVNIRKIHQDGLTCIQSIINHFRLGKEIPINQVEDYFYTLLYSLQNDRQSIIISSRLRTAENYFNQSTLSFIINLTDYLITSLNEVDNKKLCDTVIGCLLQNLPQNNNFLYDHISNNKNINQSKTELDFWYRYLDINNKLSFTTINVIRNNLQLSNDLEVGIESINKNQRMISIISSVIYMHEKQSHITKENKYFYHPIKLKIFERSLSKNMDPIMLKKIIDHFGDYPLGSTVHLNNNKLALVMRHNKDKSPSYIRIVYDIEGGCLTKPFDTLIKPSDNKMIEGICNPSYYKVHTGLINNPLNV